MLHFSCCFGLFRNCRETGVGEGASSAARVSGGLGRCAALPFNTSENDIWEFSANLI